MTDSFTLATRLEATRARNEGRANFRTLGEPSLLQLGEIEAITGSTYTVIVRDSEGEIIARYTRVHVVPETDLDIGMPVWLVFFAVAPDHPVIIPNGGENAYAYWQGYRDAGYWGAVAD